MANSNGGKGNRNYSWKDLMADILDKNFKAAVKKSFNELMEDMEKVKKMTYEQNGNWNLNRNKKRNSGHEKYNNWNEKFTSMIPKQTWAGRRISQII